VVPNEDHVVEFADVPRTNPSPGRNFRAIGNLGALSTLAVVFPSVKGTSNRFALNASALREMRAYMCAIGIEDPSLSAPGSEEHHFIIEIVDALDIADAEIFGPGDGIPTVGKSRCSAIFHVLSSGCSGGFLFGCRGRGVVGLYQRREGFVCGEGIERLPSEAFFNTCLAGGIIPPVKR
jgi:hypothetical protein